MTAAFTPYPLLLRPRLYRRLWGGTRLAARLHEPGLEVSGPEHEPVGEAWLMDGASEVMNGTYRGVTLGALAELAGAELIGAAAFARYGATVPLLAKFLDAAQDLSVQVHPDDAYALREHPGSGHLGKAEAWYVLDAAPGAEVLWGFAHAVTGDAVRQAVAAGNLENLMHHVPVAPGSVIVNPAGTVHAVGAGCILFEIQQASDLTYRLYDYGRLGADGAPRTLHLDRALAVADLSGAARPDPQPTLLPDGWTRVVTEPEFTLDYLSCTAAQPGDGACDRRSFQVLVAVRGDLELRCNGASLLMPAGATAVLPASMGRYELHGTGEALRSAVGA